MSISRQSTEYLSLVLNALPDGGIGATPASIHAEINRGARQSIWHALRALVAEGKARSAGDDMKKRYWRRIARDLQGEDG